jgi:acyl-CoA reductase-like NAD-dependent aldehyde dehydrogenase
MLVCLSATMDLKVSKTQYDRVWSYIESGKQDGARVLVGGDRRTTPGYWVDATSLPALPVLPRSPAANSLDSIHRNSP